ncbi:glutamine amidotransferase [Hyalangium versicolor]|uniref:glutamine amidotransferase n=1 Tax=Hyalangium versicolor TaxID=2861190 RepID=UPI001CCBF4A2|nr:glutamine amidotransferase [Hyalangium versicolor]
MKNVLLLKAGDAAASVRLLVGDYDKWFLQALGLSGYRFDVIAAHQGAKLPADATGYDAVMMTGSPLSVTQLEPWMVRAAALMVDAAERSIPVLGVCFGHQLLAHAYGGHVVRNPLGREIGTIQVDLTPEGQADPLFRGMPPRVAVQATHEDIVPETPSGTVLLAGNANTVVQALAFRPCSRGVQFHPEVQPEAMRALIQARAERLEEEATARGMPPGERVLQLLAGITPTPYGRQVLVNFLEHFT